MFLIGFPSGYRDQIGLWWAKDNIGWLCHGQQIWHFLAKILAFSCDNVKITSHYYFRNMFQTWWINDLTIILICTAQIINVPFELFLIGFPSGYRDQFGLWWAKDNLGWLGHGQQIQFTWHGQEHTRIRKCWKTLAHHLSTGNC